MRNKYVVAAVTVTRPRKQDRSHVKYAIDYNDYYYFHEAYASACVRRIWISLIRPWIVNLNHLHDTNHAQVLEVKSFDPKTNAQRTASAKLMISKYFGNERMIHACV